MDIPVRDLTGKEQHHGRFTIPPNGESAIPQDMAIRLVGTPDYCSDSKELLSDYHVWKDDLLHIGWSSPFYWCDGYGSIAQEIANELLQMAGVSATIVPRDYDPSDPRMGSISLSDWSELAHVPESIVKRLQEDQPKCLYGINMTYPADCHRSAFPRTIGYTMFETTAPPLIWTAAMNQCRLIMTPCEQNKEAFINRGVKTPIHVVPQGVNPEAWPVVDRSKRDQPFTFLMAGGLTYRKNPIGAVRAFLAAFPNRQDVRLILKTRAGKIEGGFKSWIENVPADPRIQIIAANCTPAEMAGYMQMADCFIWPSRGEGFGLPPLQAMATGCPVILSDNSGMSQYCDSRYNYPIPCEEVPVPRQANGGYPDDWGDCGNWWEPSFDGFVETMRQVYAHRRRAFRLGTRAAAWVRDNWTITHICQRMLEVVSDDAKEDGIEW